MRLERGLFGRLRKGLSHFKAAPGEKPLEQGTLKDETPRSLEAYREELYRREFFAGTALSLPWGCPVLNEEAVGRILNMTRDELRQQKELEEARASLLLNKTRGFS